MLIRGDALPFIQAPRRPPRPRRRGGHGQRVCRQDGLSRGDGRFGSIRFGDRPSRHRLSGDDSAPGRSLLEEWTSLRVRHRFQPALQPSEGMRVRQMGFRELLRRRRGMPDEGPHRSAESIRLPRGTRRDPRRPSVLRVELLRLRWRHLFLRDLLSELPHSAAQLRCRRGPDDIVLRHVQGGVALLRWTPLLRLAAAPHRQPLRHRRGRMRRRCPRRVWSDHHRVPKGGLGRERRRVPPLDEKREA